MGMNEKFNSARGTAAENKKLREDAILQMYKDDKKFRADKLIESWSRIPEIGAGLKKMPIDIARNTAINLDREYSFIKGLKESQVSTALNNFTPENMLRLVRLSMPNLIRNRLFSEYALETTKDSIQYVRPFWAKTANGHNLNDREATYGGGEPDDYDPWDYGKGGDFNGDDFRKALYEDTRDRANQPLANAVVRAAEEEGEYNIYFKKFESGEVANTNDNDVFLSGKWGKDGANYVDGYVHIYGYNEGDKGDKVEQQLIAMQDKRSGLFFPAPGFTVEIVKPVAMRDKFLNNHEAGITVMPDHDGLKNTLAAGKGVMTIKLTVDATKAAKFAPWYVEGETKLRAFGLFNPETDFEGNYLGEVEIKLTDYQFKPQATTIGVSWTQLTELTLETSYNLSAEELLISSASQEIRSALDYRAVRLAYATAKTNGSHNPNYYYVFDAAYNSGDGDASAARGKDGYRDNASTIVSAFDEVGNVIFDEINRGGVSRLVGGPSAVSYLKLVQGLWNSKGKQAQRGAHQEGEFDGMPVFKVPSAIIPTDEILTIWKDDQDESEVSIAFGTFVPFFSTGIIQKKTFHKEAGIATYGDWVVLNRRFLAIVKIKNMKDRNNKMSD